MRRSMAATDVMLYHEVQESKLCAVHCVNTVLQGPFFSELDFAAMADDLDRRERQMMMERGITSADYLSFMAEGSSNVAPDGNFSIQVVEKALQVWDLRVIPLESPESHTARDDPQQEDAFVCHLHDHWFTIRKVGGEWYNFNSLYPAPEHLSNFYLSAYLGSLKVEGWSIFVVRGAFPAECAVTSSDAGSSFGQWLTPEDAERIIKSTNTSGKPSEERVTTSKTAQDVSAIAAAMAASLANVQVPGSGGQQK